jgi:trigger factor
MEDQCKRQSESELQNKIIDALLKANEFEAPPSLVERQIFYMMNDAQKRMRAAGMDEKNAMELSFRMHDQFKQDAEKTVKSFLILKKIAEKEAIVPTDEDIDKHFNDLASMYHTDYEIVKSSYDTEERIDNLKSELVSKKVFDFIEREANIKIVNKMGMGEVVQ